MENINLLKNDGFTFGTKYFEHINGCSKIYGNNTEVFNFWQIMIRRPNVYVLSCIVSWAISTFGKLNVSYNVVNDKLIRGYTENPSFHENQ